MHIRWRGFELPSKVECDASSLTPNFGRFWAEPFERGFGGSAVDQRFDPLKKRILASEHLPVEVMAFSLDPRFIPEIKKQLDKADEYDKIFLNGCVAALDPEMQPQIHVSKSQPVAFRPASASVGDQRRMPPGFFGGHGDGVTRVVVSGRLLAPDGSPAKNPKAFDSTDRMLVPEQRRDPWPMNYDPKTGRFVFLAEVFAAYAAGRQKAELPGPYQTGPGVVWIEADGCEPFEFVFFDEMPHVQITLSTAQATGQEQDAEK